MWRYALFILVCLIAPLLLVEWYARGRYAAYADDEAFLQLAFERLLNSLVIPTTNQPHSPPFGYALTPNTSETIRTDEYTYTIRTNSLGFRTREIAPRDARQQQLLIVGDSMLFGVGQDEKHALTGQLERIGTSADTPLRVHNFTMIGFSSVQALIAAHAVAPQLEADYMLLGIFLGNDLLPNAISHVGADGLLAYDEGQITRLRAELHRYLAPLMPSLALRAWALQAWTPRLRYAFSAEERFLQHTYGLIDDFVALARANRARPAIAVIYPRYAVENGLVGRWSMGRKPGQLLAQYCRDQDIAVLDLLDYMDGSEDAQRYYYATDGHFNRAGNARVAQAIYDKLIGH